MRASLRWMTVLLASGVMLSPALALAQSTVPAQPGPPPPSDAIGPSELQNFSLKGSAAKPEAQQPAAPTSQPRSETPAPAQAAQASAAHEHRRPRHEQKTATLERGAGAAKSVAEVPAQAGASIPSGTPLAPSSNPAPAPMARTASASPPFPVAPTPALAPEHRLSILPWFLAAVVVAAGLLFLFRRRRQQEAFAGAAPFDTFAAAAAEPAAPEPPPVTRRSAAPEAPSPRVPLPQPPLPQPPLPHPAPRAHERSAPAARPDTRSRSGIVSSRLRPALEVSVRPLRCLIEDQRVVIEFEMELYNAGTAPARSVLAEASLFNAGANQEQELAAFFSSPVGSGERLEAIQPMKRVTFANRVVAPRSSIQEYVLGGRKTFVPVLAFNTLYQWSGGQAQTSSAFLVGRDTKGDKLAPLSLERTPRAYGSLGAHLLPSALRT